MKINLQILSTLIILWPGFAFSESKKDKNLEIAQDVRTELRAIVDDIDELIGGTRSDDNRSSSTLRLKATDASSKYTPDEPPSFDINITLKLGKVEDWKDDIKNWTHAKTQKWKGELSHKIESEVETNSRVHMVKNEKLTPDKTRKEKDPWKFSFQNRFTLKKDSIFKTHARLRKDFEYEHIINTFAIDGAWSDETKWETNGELVTNTHVTKKWALSFGNFARWGLTDHKVTSQHGPSSSYMLSDKEVLSLSYTANLAFIDNVWWADSYSISGGYRLSAWHNVLYASVNPFLNYARSNGFRQDPGISAALEAVF